MLKILDVFLAAAQDFSPNINPDIGKLWLEVLV
jgi:hypothetical protein